MKLKCPAILEAPLMNLIKLYDSLDVVGVCGILTTSTQNVKGTSISALAMMAYCNDLIAELPEGTDLQVVDIHLQKGPITYKSIADASNGLLTLAPGLTPNGIVMSTSDVDFKLVVGRTTALAPLTEERVSNFIIVQDYKHLEFTAMPLPLMTKKIVSFDMSQDGHFSYIETNDVRDNILADLIKQLGS